jgi:hypothetical protein
MLTFCFAHRLCAALCDLVRSGLQQHAGDGEVDGFAVLVLSFLTELGHDMFAKAWLGQHFMPDLFVLLHARSTANLPDLPLHKAAIKFFKTCTARMDRNQIVFADLVYQKLQGAAKFSDFLSRMTSFLLTLEDTVPVAFVDSLAKDADQVGRFDVIVSIQLIHDLSIIIFVFFLPSSRSLNL